MFTRQSEERLVDWLKNGHLDEFGAYLMSGTVHGKPGVPTAEMNRIEKLIRKRFSEGEQYSLAVTLLTLAAYPVRCIGAHLLVSGWPEAQDVETQMKRAADDEEWIVRECAAYAFAALLAKDFVHFSKLYRRWVNTESVNVKRAIALAVKYESKAADPVKWQAYRQIIEPLLSEEAEYVRKNLGPFAIGDGLLSRYPDQVLRACENWVRSENEHVRWNAAMIFTAAAARRFSEEGRALVGPLVRDVRAYVSRAARKALRNLENAAS